MSLKEFLACLTIGHVLDAFPDLSREITEEDMKLVEKSTTPLQSPTITPKAFNAKAGNGSPKSNRVSVLLIKNNSEIKEMLNLITSAYLLFDDRVRNTLNKSIDIRNRFIHFSFIKPDVYSKNLCNTFYILFREVDKEIQNFKKTLN